MDSSVLLATSVFLLSQDSNHPPYQMPESVDSLHSTQQHALERLLLRKVEPKRDRPLRALLK